MALDDRLIDKASGHFAAVARGAGKPLGRPQDFDAANFGHQVPGGVLSNLVAQLELAGLPDRIDAVLAECTRVRKELGWPIMVTPFSQLVGVQATLNVIGSERYARVPNEVKKYALGYYGKLLAPVDADILDRIVENASQDIPLEPEPPKPAVKRLRKRYPDDDELLLRHSFPGNLVDEMYAAPADDNDYSVIDDPLHYLIREFEKLPHLRQVFVRKGSFKATLGR